MSNSRKPSAKKPKSVKGWALVREDNQICEVELCDSQKWLWRKYTKIYAITELELRNMGYRAVHVRITPL
jgi:hypothetical protein